MVVLEAMTAGTPVVCLDFGGPGAMIDSHSGIKITVQDRASIVNDISKALTDLLLDKERRNELGNGAKERAKKHFTWAAKGLITSKLYLDILGINVSPKLTESENDAK